LVAGGSRRRAHPPTDATSAHRHARRGTPAPDSLARAALRGGGGRLPHRGRRGLHCLWAKPLLSALALYRTSVIGTDHGRRSDRLRSAVGGLGPASAVPADGKTPTEPSRRTSSASRRDPAT